MIHYTDALTGLIHDIVSRVEALSFIDPSRVLVFARAGRTGAAGAYATCHCLNLPPSDPGYFYWKDRVTGEVTRRTGCFVTKTPEVWVASQRIEYLISFALPRFCDQTLTGSRKAAWYGGEPAWIAKLDTVIHELYHIAPQQQGLRTFERADGQPSDRSHGPRFLEEVAGFVRLYLASGPDPAHLAFLHHDFATLTRRFGAVAGTTFRNYPSYPQRYPALVDPQPDLPGATEVPLQRATQPVCYTERDLRVRAFAADGSFRVRPHPSDRVARRGSRSSLAAAAARPDPRPNSPLLFT